MDPNKRSEFKKQLNPLNVWAIAFGCIIGWGSFINPHKKILPNSGVAGPILGREKPSTVRLLNKLNTTLKGKVLWK